MSEGNRFVVEVVGRLREEREVTVSRVCEALGLDEARAGALVARMPGVITKPVAENRAMKIALRLQEAGVPALHRPLAEHENPFKTSERPAPVAAPRSDPPPPRRDVDAVGPRDVPSLDATHHDLEPDPKLTPMSEAGFGAADIVLPRSDVWSTQERPRPRATFVEAGPTSMPTPHVVDPATTMVRPATATPTPLPTSRPVTPVPGSGRGAPTPVRHALTLTPVPPAHGTPVPPDRTPVPPAGPRTPVPAAAAATPASGSAAPVYRQTRSSADHPLTLSAPPDEVLQRSGVPDAELGRSAAKRGRFGRHLAGQVALPGLLTWSLTAVALWWFLGVERADLFIPLAAASAVAALLGALVAALGTIGISRDVVRLRDEARRIAMGELTSPVASNRDDELGELAGSLERMRLSLQEGLERLRQRGR